MYVLLDFISTSNDDTVESQYSDGMIKAAVAGFFVGPLLSAICNVVTNHLQRRVAIKSRAALVQLLYRKAVRMDLAAQESKVGEIVNLMSRSGAHPEFEWKQTPALKAEPGSVPTRNLNGNRRQR